MSNQNVPNPPKFGGPINAQGPVTEKDWDALYRWFLSVTNKANSSVTGPEASILTLQPAPIGNRGISGDEAIGTFLSFAPPRVPVPQDIESILPTALALQRPASSRPPQDDLNGYLFSSLAIPAPLKFVPDPIPPVVSAGTVVAEHKDRVAIGTGTVSGSTLTWVSGPLYQSYWVGKQIAIQDVLFVVASVAGTTSLTVTGTPTSGAVSWQMEYFFANRYPAGQLLFEIDRTVIYSNSGSSGTGNLVGGTVLNWVTGPLFSPYWAGLVVFVSGTLYTIVSSGRFSMVLSASLSAASGVSWSAPQPSTWYYAAGTMIGAASGRPTDLIEYSDLGFLYHATDRQVVYYGVRDTGLTGFQGLKFAYKQGIEAMTFATFGTRTFKFYDVGYLISITDFQHVIRYNGSNWDFGPGDSGSGFYVAGGRGFQLPAGKFHLCDGSTIQVFYLPSGVPSLQTVTLDDLTAGQFIRGGPWSGSSASGTNPSWDPAAKSDDEATHAHTLGHIVTDANTGTGLNLVAGTNTGSPTGGHHHTLSNGVAKLNVPSDSNGGLPDNFKLNWYIRL